MPNRSTSGWSTWRNAIGRTKSTLTVATMVKTKNWKGSGSPTAANPAVTNAATPSNPSAAVRVKISATTNTAAVIVQISHGSIACLF